MAKCDYCEAEVTMPYSCGYCGDSFCPKHRLPENHNCKGLDKLSEESRRKGRIYRGTSGKLDDDPDEKPQEDFRRFQIDLDRKRSERERDFGDGFLKSPSFLGIIKNFIFSNTTSILIFAMVLVYISQLIVRGILGLNFYRESFITLLAPSLNTVLYRPWTLLTSIFAHGNTMHLFLNGLVLFFIGPPLERRIGRKKFVYIFLASGAIASLAQILVTDPQVIVLGASGSIFGILGTLTVLAPKMPILLFFFLPMQLWMLTLGYGIVETILALQSAGSQIGHMAHVSGLAVGLIYGYKLRREGLGRYESSIEDLFKRFGI